jgi:excisionase family DNA binding protein
MSARKLITHHREDWLSVTDAAIYCDVHYRTVRRWIAEGRLNAVRVGPKLLKVSVADLDSLMQPVGGNAK